MYVCLPQDSRCRLFCHRDSRYRSTSGINGDSAGSPGDFRGAFPSQDMMNACVPLRRRPFGDCNHRLIFMSSRVRSTSGKAFSMDSRAESSSPENVLVERSYLIFISDVKK